MRRIILLWVEALILAAVPQCGGSGKPAEVPVGAAVVDITPDYPIRMVGLREPEDGIRGDCQPPEGQSGWLSGGPERRRRHGTCRAGCRRQLARVGTHVTEKVAERLKTKVGLPRERFVVCSTHTHCGPGAGAGAGFHLRRADLPTQKARIDRYTNES